MFTAELFKSSEVGWEKIKDAIIGLEQEAFGESAFPAQELENDFLDNRSIVLLLKEDKGSVVGFLYAKPIEVAEPSRANEKGETAYLWNISINKDFRGKKLSGVLMNKMEEELKKLGYKYMELDAVVSNNFAGNIEKNYKDRILKSEEHDSKWGLQIYFKIKL